MRQRGLTLVELLIVISIIVVLMAALAPVFRSGLEERKLAEATRGISGIIMKAKAMAAESGRPVGIALERLDASDPVGNPIGALQSVQIYVVEVPVPYTGDIDDATCLLRDMNHGQGPDGQWGYAGVDDDNTGMADDSIGERGAPGSDDGDGQPETATFGPAYGSEGGSVLVNAGDLIRFNFRGPFYQVVGKVTRPGFETDVVFTHTEATWGPGANNVYDPQFPYFPIGGRYGSDDVWLSPPAPQAAFKESRFQVYRAPVRTLAQPYNMPTGTTIDLNLSGLGPAGVDFGVTSPGTVFNSPIVIMFNPQGEVDSIYRNGSPFRAQQPIYLMVGQADLVSVPLVSTLTDLVGSLFDDRNGDSQKQATEDGFSNLTAGNQSKWVTIGHRNGLVTVSENDTITLNTGLATPTQTFLDGVIQARATATESQTYGGR